MPRPRQWRLAVPVFGAVAVAVVASVSLFSLGSTASAAGSLLSQGKVATSSTPENDTVTPARAAFDANLTGTRWSSQFVDDAWLQVDLGTATPVGQIVLTWEAAYGSAYRIDGSTDGTTWSSLYSTSTGKGGTETLAVSGTARYVKLQGVKRATGYGYSLWEMQVYGTPVGATSTPTTSPTSATNPPTPTTSNVDPGESMTLATPNPYPAPDIFDPPVGNEPSHHEFQANCAPTRSLPDDPIVFPSQPGASHSHTFMGSTTTDAFSTTAKLMAGSTSCTDPHDRSGYWFPTVFNGTTPVIPQGNQVIYYKSGINDYKTVKPFPKGLRFVVGNAKATTAADFQNSPGTVVGWECGSLDHVYDIPANCPAGSQLNVRFQAPSCWDGIHLDSADHKSHMAYPVNGHCPSDHPVALIMLEFKMAFPVSGDMSQVHLASGRGFTWHYDFFMGWDPAQISALTVHCINGGLQCDPHGYDLYKPARGSALDASFNVINGTS